MPATPQLCPRCEQPLTRVRRSLQDRQDGSVRRWRCAAPGCAWAGLLPARQATPAAAETRHAGPVPRLHAQRLLHMARRARWPRWGLVLAFGLMLAVAAGGWFLRPATPPTVLVGSHVVHRGTHLDGERLPADHPLQTLLPAKAMEVEPGGYTQEAGRPLRVRRHCAWGLPGRNPYKGSPEQALYTATLSNTVVRQISADIRAGRRVDRVQIDNGGIRAQRTGREFDPARVAMTYGMTLCVDTRMNFKPGHSEGGDLYEAMDDDGRMYAVMVPDVCGNVSVLGQRYVRPTAAPTAPGGAAPGGTAPGGAAPSGAAAVGTGSGGAAAVGTGSGGAALVGTGSGGAAPGGAGSDGAAPRGAAPGGAGSGGAAPGGGAPVDARPWMRLAPEDRPRELPGGLRYADPRAQGNEAADADGNIRSVSTPGTLALSGIALAALWLARRARR